LVPAVVLFAVGGIIMRIMPLGPLSFPMALHIASMSIAAPLAVCAIYVVRGVSLAPSTANAASLWASTLLQLVLLWALHTPLAQTTAMSSPLASVFMHLSVFAAALWFWRSIAAAAGQWQAIFALLLTGKLVCLLGALLIFAPRLLCAPAPEQGADLTLADQQLAGLLMVSGCSLSYVLAAVIVAARTMDRLAQAGRPRLAISR
jgi:putative membrane protein